MNVDTQANLQKTCVICQEYLAIDEQFNPSQVKTIQQLIDSQYRLIKFVKCNQCIAIYHQKCISEWFNRDYKHCCYCKKLYVFDYIDSDNDSSDDPDGSIYTNQQRQYDSDDTRHYASDYYDDDDQTEEHEEIIQANQQYYDQVQSQSSNQQSQQSIVPQQDDQIVQQLIPYDVLFQQIQQSIGSQLEQLHENSQQSYHSDQQLLLQLQQQIADQQVQINQQNETIIQQRTLIVQRNIIQLFGDNDHVSISDIIAAMENTYDANQQSQSSQQSQN